MDESKHKSRRDDLERKEDSKRSYRERERNGERHKEREKGREKKERESRHSERERSVDDKHREKGSVDDKHRERVRERERSIDDKNREKAREREISVDDKKREKGSVDDKHRERARERERSVDDKHKERARERERSVDDKKRERERERSVDDKLHREREKNRDKHRERTKDKDGVEKEDRDREKEKERLREKEEKEKEKERLREKEREREEREREREKERIREREREEREKERIREREREEREKERARERERLREREKREREKERERERDRREREKRREMEKGESTDDGDGRDHDRKRRRRDDDHKERERERGSRSNRHRDESEESPKKDSDAKVKRTREEDLEEEQRKLDEEMEKRRRRVEEWQELKRKKEETEREHLGEEDADEPKSGKAWTLEGESDDEDAAPIDKMDTDMNLDEDAKPVNGVGEAMAIDSDNEMAELVKENGDGDAVEEDEIDPLDAFMNSLAVPEAEKISNVVVPSTNDDGDDDGGGAGGGGDVTVKKKKDKKDARGNGKQARKGLNKFSIGRIIPGDGSDEEYTDLLKDDEEPSEDEPDDEFMKRVRKTKAEKLTIVDHSKIEYLPFRKSFYIEAKEITRMTPEEVAVYRRELELKLHGKDVPKPIKTWHQIGLTNKVLEIIKKLNFEKPMPIQAQALPVIMSGRDCIGVAKTGSGKTLAFVLPMLRHIKDQPPLKAGDGPIGLVMAPTRELVQQIHSDIKKFAKGMGLFSVAVYGGSGVAQQISDLKRGCEIVVCTPGRMIDILCTSGGKITNLRRVSFFVMDEADRMFDMGFEPQITRIVQNTRPDRQTVLFSATFPRQVEILARKVLTRPVEIQVGGRSVVNKDIAQLVEVRPENERFLRLLELLGEWYEKGKILIFVHSQEKCDALFREMIKHGYPCLSLHGAKDQPDRESTISDFKSNVCNLLVATSIAARGLDVKELELVINFDVPNHYEDYVHRVGRTGRAGRKGCAITFISDEDARYAPDLVKALELSEQVVPDDLKALADGFMAKVNQGLEQAHGTGYGGSGFKFNEEEDEVRRAAKKAQAKEYGFEEDKTDSEDEDDGVRKAGGDISQHAAMAQVAAMAAASSKVATPMSAVQLLPNGGLPISLPGVLGLSMPGATAMGPGSMLPMVPNDGAARAAALAAAINLQHNLAKIQADAMPEHYEAELEINDFPQNARWKVTHKETLGPISEWTGAAITTRGQYYPPGKATGPGERKLYLFIEGPTEQSVKRAKSELKRVLEDITTQAVSLPGAAQPGRYSVL